MTYSLLYYVISSDMSISSLGIVKSVKSAPTARSWSIGEIFGICEGAPAAIGEMFEIGEVTPAAP